VPLVNQSGLDRLGGEVGTAHADVTSPRRFHLPNIFRFEVSRVHDLVGRPPSLREVLDERRLIREVHGLPGDEPLLPSEARILIGRRWREWANVA